MAGAAQSKATKSLTKEQELRFLAVKLVMEVGSMKDKDNPFQKAEQIVAFVNKEE